MSLYVCGYVSYFKLFRIKTRGSSFKIENVLPKESAENYCGLDSARRRRRQNCGKCVPDLNDKLSARRYFILRLVRTMLSKSEQIKFKIFNLL